MIPRWHVFYGAIFSILLWVVAPNIGLFNLILVFLSSVFIDLDHYISAVKQNRSLNPFKAFRYYDKLTLEIAKKHKKGIRMREPHFHVFHTIEFHILIALLGLIWTPFFYIFIGMTFHSLLDVYSLMKDDYLYLREYFFFNWLRRSFEND